MTTNPAAASAGADLRGILVEYGIELRWQLLGIDALARERGPLPELLEHRAGLHEERALVETTLALVDWTETCGPTPGVPERLNALLERWEARQEEAPPWWRASGLAAEATAALGLLGDGSGARAFLHRFNLWGDPGSSLEALWRVGERVRWARLSTPADVGKYLGRAVRRERAILNGRWGAADELGTEDRDRAEVDRRAAARGEPPGPRLRSVPLEGDPHEEVRLPGEEGERDRLHEEVRRHLPATPRATQATDTELVLLRERALRETRNPREADYLRRRLEGWSQEDAAAQVGQEKGWGRGVEERLQRRLEAG